MKFFFKLIVLALVVYGGWWLWENYDLKGWYDYISARMQQGLTAEVFVMPKKKGETFPPLKIIYLKDGCVFSPSEITIQKGEKIYWYNATGSQQGIWGDNMDLKYFQPQRYLQKTFNDAGIFNYSCADEEKSSGKIIIN